MTNGGGYDTIKQANEGDVEEEEEEEIEEEEIEEEEIEEEEIEEEEIEEEEIEEDTGTGFRPNTASMLRRGGFPYVPVYHLLE
jgi:hypothetical protein